MQAVSTTDQLRHSHFKNFCQNPSRVAKSSASLGWGKGGNVTSVGREEVTECDSVWHVNFHSSEACKPANGYTPFTLLRSYNYIT